jgi:V8-like Glu-specific endopeptidase
MLRHISTRRMQGGLVVLMVLALMASREATSQQRYLYRFDVRTGSKDSTALQEVAPMTSSTAWSVGALQHRIDLPAAPHDIPRDSMMPHRPAAEALDLSSWPSRCASALRRVVNDSVKPSCSAILVGPRWVLTAGHCIRRLYDLRVVIVPGERRVYPSWDLGAPRAGVAYADVHYAYCVSMAIDDVTSNDVALLELDRPIGNDVGYVGLRTYASPQSIDSIVGHILSYPAGGIWFYDSTKSFDGDRMYYRRGRIDDDVRSEDAFTLPTTVGVPGESGSSLLIRDGDGYASVGVLYFAFDARCRRLDATTFEAFRRVMGVPTTVTDRTVDVDRNARYDDVRVYDLMGRLVHTAQHASIDALQVPPGPYVAIVIRDHTIQSIPFLQR